MLLIIIWYFFIIIFGLGLGLGLAALASFNIIAIDIKPSTCPTHGRQASVCKISPSYDAAFRRRGYGQNKQTLKYLVEIDGGLE